MWLHSTNGLVARVRSAMKHQMSIKTQVNTIFTRNNESIFIDYPEKQEVLNLTHGLGFPIYASV